MRITVYVNKRIRIVVLFTLWSGIHEYKRHAFLMHWCGKRERNKVKRKSKAFSLK